MLQDFQSMSDQFRALCIKGSRTCQRYRTSQKCNLKKESPSNSCAFPMVKILNVHRNTRKIKNMILQKKFCSSPQKCSLLPPLWKLLHRINNDKYVDVHCLFTKHNNKFWLIIQLFLFFQSALTVSAAMQLMRTKPIRKQARSL